MQTLELVYDGVIVAGLRYRADAAMDFMEAMGDGNLGGIRLEPEPDNEHDPHAIKVIGWWEDEERHVGYVPAILAELIAFKKMRGLLAELADYDLVEGTNNIVIEIRILVAG